MSFWASMGPRFFKRGDQVRIEHWNASNQLQWGHASLSVETRPSRMPSELQKRASMGPRFFKRGDNIKDVHFIR